MCRHRDVIDFNIGFNWGIQFGFSDIDLRSRCSINFEQVICVTIEA